MKRQEIRRVVFNAGLALASLIASLVLEAILRPPREFSWSLPLVGFGGYLFFARRAMRVWRADPDAIWRGQDSNAIRLRRMK
jgi:hypothetical protein